MTIVTADLTITLDGYAAAPDQTRERPFGSLDEERLHAWAFGHEDESPEERAAITAARAYVMGRNMFGPDRGDWDLEWRGWWGDDPPYHGPVFVVCHRPRPSVPMEGGTTFHFVTDGVEAAVERARDAAGDGDVSIAGGTSTLNQCLAAGLVDELRLHVAPFVSGLAGSPGRLFDGVPDLTLRPVSARPTPHVTHVVYRRG
jgi:dihydrofolate reductase